MGLIVEADHVGLEVQPPVLEDVHLDAGQHEDVVVLRARLADGGDRLVELIEAFPEEMVGRHPFPGPGLAIRIIGEVTVERLETLGLARESEGATVVFLDEEKLPPCIVRKRDGGFNYATSDLATIVHREHAYHKGQRVITILKDLIPRQLFVVPIQAYAAGRVISRANVKAMRKDVLAKCYGGDITRKKKLLEKQKEGKKRMKQVGSVEIPQEAFLAVLKVGE